MRTRYRFIGSIPRKETRRVGNILLLSEKESNGKKRKLEKRMREKEKNNVRRKRERRRRKR